MLDSEACSVTIEAAEPGAVVLNAMGQRAVLWIKATGVELIGLNISGGYSALVSACFWNT